MKNLIIGLFIVSLSSSLFAGSWSDRFNSDIVKLQKETELKIEKEDKEDKRNKILHKNMAIEAIEKRNLPDILIKKPKKVNIFVRKSYKKIGSDIIVASPAQWKTIIVQEKQEWEY